jgi:hypothetical protein
MPNGLLALHQLVFLTYSIKLMTELLHTAVKVISQNAISPQILVFLVTCWQHWPIC